MQDRQTNGFAIHIQQSIMHVINKQFIITCRGCEQIHDPASARRISTSSEKIGTSTKFSPKFKPTVKTLLEETTLLIRHFFYETLTRTLTGS